MISIGLVVGTRPEVIKMFPVYRRLVESDRLQPYVINTGQHREMVDELLRLFGMKANINLGLMRPRQSLAYITASVLERLESLLEARDCCEVLLVQGDTTTAMAAAMSAFYAGIPVGHVEAGLRTWNKKEPYPEEVNRQVISRVADFHYCPTEWARQNLVKEGIREGDLLVTGNTVVDSLLWIRNSTILDAGLFPWAVEGRPYVLVTGHRRENWGEGIENVCGALLDVLHDNKDLLVVYAAHPNPRVREGIYKLLRSVERGPRNRFLVLEPVSYGQFVHLMARAKVIVSDSGGIQEEAPSLGVPVVCTRERTERPEGVDAGLVTLVGTMRSRVRKAILAHLETRGRPRVASNPYGDGNAGQRIVAHLERYCATRR